jgi:polysaccharide export outer membrane protein
MFCLILVSCADQRAGRPVGHVQSIPDLFGKASDASLPPQTGTAAKSPGHRIQPQDTLQITVFNELDLSLKATVSPQGTINYPLLGSVDVGGLTVLEAEKKMMELLGHDYLVRPFVAVTVERAAVPRVFLLGQVKTPGSLEIPADENLTLVQAISRAGGFTDLAASNRVTIIRSENGRQQKMVVNVAAIIKGGNLSEDVVLKPDDVVSVPQSLF